ncbi:DUF4157 domain-containing protein, partial [Sphingomonas sp. dw_22]|uniref:eCIS core domain-containing protein n=1 Tax=Sphingomonas sp. dw_22 TaxID=2721175 RepID=UPI001BD4DFC1
EAAAAIRGRLGGGMPLPAETRGFMEPRFGADLGGVRVHNDGKAQGIAAGLGARALTYSRDIFFGPGEFQPDSRQGKRLIAHELTHTVQQREVVQREVTVRERSAPQVQRGLLSGIADAVGGAIDAVGDAIGNVLQIVRDFVAEKAEILPGFHLLCLVLGHNPINDAATPGGGPAILRELVGFIPFGDKIVEALENHGVIARGGAFIDQQIAGFKRVVSSVTGAIGEFFGSLGPSDAIHPIQAWNRAKSIFSSPVNEMKSFASGLVTGFVDLVVDVILKPLGQWAAANVPHWDLLMAVLGKNPVSGEGESPASRVIGLFMNLIGQGEVWENIQRAKAIPRAWAWFQKALGGAKALVVSIPGEVMATVKSLTIVDVLTIAGAFRKIAAAFAGFVGRLMGWAGGTVLDLLEIILDVVAPAAVPYLKKAGGAFRTIVRNPIGFVRTLVAAGKAGFQQFAANFLTHLKASLIGWLTGALGGAGVYIPQGFSFMEILKFVLSVMGLTWANIRGKLVRVTNETTVKALETGFDIVVTLVRDGPAAAWQQILETLSNLKQMAIDAVMDFVKSKVVEAAVTKLLSMLSPAGAFIQAIIAIYNTIMFFVERLQQIAQVAASLIDGIAAIAAGNIAPAAARVERTMAGLLTLVISFLARLAGLGKVSDAVLGLIKKIRDPIDKALDKVVAWIVAQAKKLGKMLLGSGKPQTDTRTAAQKEAAVIAAQSDANTLIANPEATEASIEKGLGAIKQRHKLTAITIQHESKETFIEVVINPRKNSKKRKFDPANMVVGDVIIIRHRDIKMKGGEKITWIPGTATAVDQAKQTFDWKSSNLKTPRTWGKIPFADQDTKWKKGHTSQVLLSEVKILELNESESWSSFADARVVLNWRHHEQQLNPAGKQWEHIIEQFAGGANASGNLALSDSTVNNQLGQFFGKPYASHEAPAGLPGTAGQPLRQALKGQSLHAQNRWKQHFYGQLGVSLKWSKSVRGLWRELS